MAYPHSTAYGQSGNSNGPHLQRRGTPQGQQYGQGQYHPDQPPRHPRQQMYPPHGHGDQHTSQGSNQGQWCYRDQEHDEYYEHQRYDDQNGNYGQPSHDDHSYHEHSPSNYNQGGPQDYRPEDYAPPRAAWAKPQRSFSSGDAQGLERQAANMTLNGHGQTSGPYPDIRKPDNLNVAKRHDRERALPMNDSPQNLAWDNPFPTFPASQDKQKAPMSEGHRPSTASSARSRESARSIETQRSAGRGSTTDGRRDDRTSNQLSSIQETGAHHLPNENDRTVPFSNAQWPMQDRPGTAQGIKSEGGFAPGPPGRSFTMPNQVSAGPAPRHGPSSTKQGSWSDRSRSAGTDASKNSGSSQQPDDEEDMPNFDAVAPNNGKNGRAALDKELHMSPKQDLGIGQPYQSMAGPLEERGRRHDDGGHYDHVSSASRSRSQPNTRRHGGEASLDYYGFDFGGEVKPPPVPMQYREQQGERPSFDSNRSYSTSTPQSIRQRNMGPSPGPPPSYGQRPTERPYGPPPLNVARAISGSSSRNSPMPSPVDRRTPISAGGRPMNPDALPQHPLPQQQPKMLRKPQTPLGGGGRPPPVRQYTTPVEGPQIAPPTPGPGQGGPPLVTHEELQQLRGAVNANPNDQHTQLLLARKLVEAAATLADDHGRADPKTRAKNRERWASEAQRLVKKLVAHGDPESMFFLADQQTALGLPKDPKDAFELYQKAAKQGHSQAAYRVAVCCELGLDEGGGTRRDPLKAVQWYQRAASLGDVPAMYKLGMIQLKGLLGQTRDPRAALPWLEQAAARADSENPHALHELGLLHEGAVAGCAGIVALDLPRARQCFQQAADLGYKFAQFRLGAAFEHGRLGCPVDARQSVAWYSRAAAQEEHQSELALSGWYLTGAEGVLGQSDTEAYLWARKAASAGLAKAEYAMGYYTETGIGVDANLEAAKRWYWKAASQNFPKAKERLEDLRRGGSRIQKTRVSRTAVQKSDGDCIIM